MALIAQYSGTHQPLNCRVCGFEETQLRQHSLAHIAGSKGMFTQTRIEVDCENCGQVSVYWLGGDDLKVEEAGNFESQEASDKRHRKLAAWIPGLDPLFAWLNG